MSDFCEKSQGFDYIFGRMNAIYGNDFARKWDGIDANLIRQEWIGTLGSFLTYRPSMDYALTHIDPARPPSSLQFRNICQHGPTIPPREPLVQIERKVPEYSDKAKREALAKLAELRKQMVANYDKK
jgi:hypothetical protein